MRHFMNIVTALCEGRDAPLYHATTLPSAVQILDTNVILDRASWVKTTYPEENDPEKEPATMTGNPWVATTDYEWQNNNGSNWLPDGRKVSAVNLTRNLQFALGIPDDVVFALDQAKLSQNYRLSR